MKQSIFLNMFLIGMSLRITYLQVETCRTIHSPLVYEEVVL